MFLGGFAGMASCWAFIFLGQMHFYSHFCMNRPLFCRVIFAMITNVVAAIGIVVLAKISSARSQSGSFSTGIKREFKCLLTAFSLAAGWSWEQTFDAAMDASVDHFGTKVHHLKIIMSVSLICIILPTYVNYIKPRADQKTASLG